MQSAGPRSSSRPRSLPLALVAVLIALIAPAVPAGPARAADPGTVVLPPRYSNQPVPVQKLRTSEAAVVYYRNEGSDDNLVNLVLRRVGGGRELLPAAMSADASVAGAQVVVQVPVPDRLSASRPAVVDLATGTTTYGEPYPYRPGTIGTAIDYFVAATGDGWLDVRGPSGDQSLVRHFTDGRPAVTVRPEHNIVSGAVADTTGALITEFVDSSSMDRRLVYVDFASGASTLLYTDTAADPGILGGFDLSPHSVAWLQTGLGIYKAPRTDLSAVTHRVVSGSGTSVDNFAVSDDALAWVRTTTDAAGHRHSDAVTALDGQQPVTGPAVAGDSLGLGHVDRGDFGFVAGSTGRDRGVYRLTPGTASFSEVIDSAGMAPPLSVEAAAGRLAYAFPSAAAGTEDLFDQGIDTTADGVAERGGERMLAVTTGQSDVTAARTAYLVNGRTTISAVVKDGVTTVATVPLEPATWGVAVSGHRLVTKAYAEDGVNPVPGSTYVRDLRDLTRAPVVYRGIESTAVSGHRLAYLAKDGSIRVRDLDGAEPDVIVKPAGFPSGAETDGRQNRMTLLMSGDWVAWSFPSRDDLAATVQTRAARVSDGGATVYDVAANPVELRLADGLLAFLDRDDRDVHLVSLSERTDQVLGQARRAAINRDFLALDDDFLAYVAPDDATHVIRTPSRADAPPTLLGGTVPTAFSPDGDRSGDSFVPRLDASRPLTSYQLTLTDGAGNVVDTVDGQAADGGLRAAWAGRDAAGNRVPDGVYRWTVQGSGGPERGDLVAGGRQAALTGQVRVDTVDPARVTAAAPARISDTSVSPRFRVSWAGSESGLAYDVDVSRMVRTATGALTASTPRRWLTATKARSAVYAGSPYATTPGDLLRFTVTGRDAAGNGRTATAVTTTVPYDDRYAGLLVSHGWSSFSATNRYGGSARLSGAGGSRIGLSGSLTRVQFVGDRCSTCGRYRIVVDGRAGSVLSSYSATGGVRQVLATVTLPRGAHRVELVVVGTSGRTVRVDAIAAWR